MTSALGVAGTTFWQDSVGTTNEATIYEELPQVISVDPIGVALETVDVTSLDSMVKTYIPGLRDQSSISVEMNWVNSSEQQTLRSTYQGGWVRWYRVVYPDGSGVAFGGVLESFEMIVETGTGLRAKFTIKANTVSYFDSLRLGLRLIGYDVGWRANSAADPWSGSGLVLNQDPLDITVDFLLRADSVDHAATIAPWPITECTLEHGVGGDLRVLRFETFGRDTTPFKIIPHTNHHIQFRTDGAGTYTLTFDGVEFSSSYTDTFGASGNVPALSWGNGGEFEGTFWDWKLYEGAVLHHAWPLIGNGVDGGNGTTGDPNADLWIDEPTTGVVPARHWAAGAEKYGPTGSSFWWFFPYTS